MRRFKMLVFSEPFEGRDAEFDEWYTGRHLDDICALEGFAGHQEQADLRVRRYGGRNA